MKPLSAPVLLAALPLACCPAALAQRGDHAGEPQPDIPPDVAIPEAPALTPEQALGTFTLAEPGFTISLAASEPMIADPVSAVFDADGRLWIVEMQSYMPNIDGEGELAPTSRIVVLEDRDGDWVFEEATTFLDDLVLPRSVLPCYGGALVIAPPHLLFAKDTDGDGRADDIRTLLDGFGGLDNPEHAGNGLLYGLDNWIHISQHNVEVRFDGERLETRPIPGHGQWGITQDDWGRIYYCPNSDVLRGDLFPKHYAARNPSQRGVRGMNAEIMHDKSVFPGRMNPGINRGYQDHMLRDDYTLAVTTSACSPLIYRSAAWGPDFSGNSFTCEPAGNCLMRVILQEGEDGVARARRAYPDTEFLTSTDERFRPVALATGPDGALFVVDMYRGVIQHKTYVTTFLRKQVEERELEKPIHLGRIWRISRDGQGPGPASHTEDLLPLSAQPSDRLVELLDHPDAFYREHAQKLLVERRAVDVQEQLWRLARLDTSRPLTRAHALWTLEGLGLLDKAVALSASRVVDDKLAGQAARLLEPWAEEPEVAGVLLATLEERDQSARLQAATSLGAIMRDVAFAPDVAGALLHHGRDPLVRSAIISGLHERETLVLEHVPRFAREPDDAQREAIAELASTALRGSPEQRTRYLDLVASSLPHHRWFSRLLLERLAAEQRLDSDSPRSLALSAEPEPWLRELGRGLWDIHGLALAVTARLTWPGHDGAAPQTAPLTLDQRELYRRGQRLFDVCAACHGFDGRGLQGQAPPLAASPIATGPESRALRVLLHGLRGPIVRDGIEYDAEMPAAPFDSDEDLAAVLTYVRRAFGNTADPVEPAAVGAVRAASPRALPWTEAELMEIE